MITVALLSAASLHAQNSEPQKPVKTGNEWKMPGDVVQRSHHFADSLRKKFDLDDETTRKLFDAYLSNTKPVDEIIIMTSDEKERKGKLKANHAEFNEKLKSILSPDKYKQYLKDDTKADH